MNTPAARALLISLIVGLAAIVSGACSTDRSNSVPSSSLAAQIANADPRCRDTQVEITLVDTEQRRVEFLCTSNLGIAEVEARSWATCGDGFFWVGSETLSIQCADEQWEQLEKEFAAQP